jgi:hypothetical protein
VVSRRRAGRSLTGLERLLNGPAASGHGERVAAAPAPPPYSLRSSG